MKNTKFIVRVAMSVALLIAGQLALTGIQGIEVVTVMMLCLCYSYGIGFGLATATVFSLVRCLVFGFQVDIILLYLIYYNLFALLFGWLGKRFAGKVSFVKTVVVVALAVICTMLFTMLDNGIKLVFYGMKGNAARVYILQSLPVMFTQAGCTAITVSVLFPTLTKVIKKINF